MDTKGRIQIGVRCRNQVGILAPSGSTGHISGDLTV